jgi:DNA (cytosine-5)-methyltransferase 1
LSIGGGAVRDAVLNDFTEFGYTVTYKVLMASDYGVPQNRRRAIFVGLLNGETFAFPAKNIEKPVTTFEALSDLPEDSIEDGENYPSEPQSEYQQFIRKDSDKLYNHQITMHTAETKRIIAMVPDGENIKVA